MQEEIARKVLSAYLRQMGHKPVVTRGAGPDILYEGIAVEVKGSAFDLKNVLNQLTRYALTQATLEVCFPVDAVSIDLLKRLRCLESALRAWNLDNQRSIGIYLVGDHEEGGYCVRRYSSITDLLRTIEERLDQQFYISKLGSDDVDSVIADVQRKLADFDSVVIETMKEDVTGTAYRISGDI